jgi:hypothetical protein
VHGDHESAYQQQLRRVVQLADASPGELRAVACAAEWLDVPQGIDVGCAGAYLVLSGALEITSSARRARVEAGQAFVAGSTPARGVACADATVVTISPREWRALHALAPGVVATIERDARPGVVQKMRGRGSVVTRGAAESRAAMRIVCR